ncbi:hypothetical protein ACRARH_19655 [Phytobacter ursingii]
MTFCKWTEGKSGVFHCDQPGTIDMGARSGKRLEGVPEAIANKVLARLEAIRR